MSCDKWSLKANCMKEAYTGEMSEIDADHT